MKKLRELWVTLALSSSLGACAIGVDGDIVLGAVGSPAWVSSASYATKMKHFEEVCKHNYDSSACISNEWQRVHKGAAQQSAQAAAAAAQASRNIANSMAIYQQQQQQMPSLMTGDQLNRSNGAYVSSPEPKDYMPPCWSRGEFSSGNQLKTCKYECSNGDVYRTIKSWEICPMSP